MKKELNDVLNKNLIYSIESNQDSILITLINGFSILINGNQSSNQNKDLSVFKNILILNDNKFKELELFINNQKNSNSLIYDTLYCLKSKKVNKIFIKQYRKIFAYKYKKLISEFFKLKEHPDSEIFFFGNDESRPRFKQSNIKNKKINSVTIIDESAILIVKKDTMPCIDIRPSHLYMDSKYIYLNSKIMQYIEVSPSEADFVSIESGTTEKKYFKISLKSGINLDLEPKVEYKEIYNKIFKVTKTKDKEFFFLNEKNERINIVHPDLLVSVN